LQILTESKASFRPDERVVHDFGDLHLERLVDLLVGEDSFLNRDLTEAAALTAHRGVDVLLLLTRDLLLSNEQGAEAELLLVRAGVDE